MKVLGKRGMEVQVETILMYVDFAQIFHNTIQVFTWKKTRYSIEEQVESDGLGHVTEQQVQQS